VTAEPFGPTRMRLLIVTDWSLEETRLLNALQKACALGAEVGVQHRHPGAPTRAFLQEARALAALCAEYGNPFFVNGRLDVALLVGAHLHLPVDGPTPSEVRPHLPKGRMLSAAAHDEAELARAVGADWVLLSPVFRPSSKPGDTRPTLGPEGYARLRARSSCPTLALGGIRLDTLPLLGPVEGLAVQGAVLADPDPAGVARALLAGLSAARRTCVPARGP
jgi:thiamine-phosphate pyrophosphorylase